MSTPAPTTRPGRAWTAALCLIVGLAAARIIYLVWFCPYSLIEDEAHYWEWSRRLGLSYYSKGPGIAWAIAACTRVFGTHEWSVRLPAVVASALAMIAVAGLVNDVFRNARAVFFAAACFARASPKLDRMLVESKLFGPTLIEWRRHRSIPWRTKLVALTLMSTMILISATWFVPLWWAKALLVAVGVATGIWLWFIPSRDRPAR